jgi:hypothetical protein
MAARLLGGCIIPERSSGPIAEFIDQGWGLVIWIRCKLLVCEQLVVRAHSAPAIPKTTIVTSAAVMGGATIREAFGAGDMPHLTDADPTAKAMAYVDDETISKNELYKLGSVCANCKLYNGGMSGYGDRQLFPGKPVSAKDGCTSYMRKAS